LSPFCPIGSAALAKRALSSSVKGIRPSIFDFRI